MFPNPFPFPENPSRLYGDPTKYFEAHDEAEKVEHYRGLVRDIKGRAGRESASILDVGAGRAELLRAAMCEALTDVVGLEFAPAMVEHARRHGIHVELATIEKYADSAARTFDVVVLNAVLEHVYDPNAMIAAAARLTRGGSVLYIDVPREPNLLTYVGNTIQRVRGQRTVLNLSPTFSPYHVFGFNPKAIATLLAKHGFVIEELAVGGGSHVPARSRVVDRVVAFGATQINRIANRTRLGHNMTIWARRKWSGADG